MVIASAMLSQSMDEANHRLGPAIGFPSLAQKFQIVGG
jgi:hypothetical protein